MILSDFIGHRSFIQGNLQSEEDYYPYLGRRRRRRRIPSILISEKYDIVTVTMVQNGGYQGLVQYGSVAT